MDLQLSIHCFIPLWPSQYKMLKSHQQTLQNVKWFPCWDSSMNKNSLYFWRQPLKLFLFLRWYCQCFLTPMSWDFSQQLSDALHMRQENTHVQFGKHGSKIGPNMTFPSFFKIIFGYQFCLKNANNNRNRKIWTQCSNQKFSRKSGGFATMYQHISSIMSMTIVKVTSCLWTVENSHSNHD